MDGIILNSCVLLVGGAGIFVGFFYILWFETTTLPGASKSIHLLNR